MRFEAKNYAVLSVLDFEIQVHTTHITMSYQISCNAPACIIKQGTPPFIYATYKRTMPFQTKSRLNKQSDKSVPEIVCHQFK